MEFVNPDSEKNFDAFETLYKRLRAKEIEDGHTVSVKACVHNIRIMSDFSFVILRTARRLFQSVYDPKTAKFNLEDIAEGMYVNVKGRLIREERSKIGYDFLLLEAECISKPEFELPFVINKKELDIAFDTLLDYRVVSLRNPNERAILKICEGVMGGFRRFFESEGFSEFVAPKLVSEGAEGGADMFEVRYFDRFAKLNQSPQMYKQMMVGVFDKVFCFSPVFRAEKSHTSRHITEFQGIDVEMGYIDSFQDIMTVEAKALMFLFDYLKENYQDELSLLRVNLPERKPIPQIEFLEVKDLIAKKYKRDYRSPDDLEPEEEKLIGDYFNKEYRSQLVFITKYPSSKRPFYAMDDPRNESYTESFDLLLNGAEITTGGQRIHNYTQQVQKMERRGMNVGEFDNYLMMHKYGLPPHGGFGIGLERFVMKLLKLDNIRRATAFPRDVDRLNP